MDEANKQAGVAVRWHGLARSGPGGPGDAGGAVAVAGPVSASRLVANSWATGGDDVAVIGLQDQSDRDRARAAIRDAIVAELAERCGLPR
ncbi:MAG: hypothetical protein WCC39_12335, partial [Telluria sp.]